MLRVKPCLFVSLVTAVVAGGCGGTNRSPVLLDQRVTTDEDVAIDIKVLDADSDPDGDTLTVTGATLSQNTAGHRVEVIDHKVVRLTPAPDFNGTIDVLYDVSDGMVAGVSGHVTVTVKPVNDAPVATGGSRDLHGRHPVTLDGSDVEHDALRFEVTGNPAHGTITGNAPDLVYAPDSGFTGDDAITYRVSDGKLMSQPARLELHVSPGAAPVAIGGNVTTPEDLQVAIALVGSDADGDVLTFAVATRPQHGTLDGTPPDLVFTPDANFHGDDAIEFTVSDGLQSSVKAQLALHVTAVNDPPVATAQAQATTEDTDLPIALAGSDVDGDALTFEIKDAPQHGTLSVIAGASVTYTPARDYHGPDHFTFVASDGDLKSAPATVELQVAAAEDPPVAIALTRTLAEDTPDSITLVGADIDGDPLQFAIADRPAHGTLSGDPPSMTYSPDPDFNGDDAFTYTVSDGMVTSAPATVTVHVTAVNDRPVAVDGAVTTDEDTAVAIVLQASDVDGQSLSYSVVSAPADGTLTGSGANRSYHPALNVSGTRSFTFRVSDGSLTADATVTITINPLNDPPVAADDFAATDPGSALTFSVTSNDTDIDGDSVTLDAVDPPAHGTAAIVDGKIAYTPGDGFTGLEDFGYTIGDGHGGSAHGTVHLGVGSFPPGAPTEAIALIDQVSFSFTGPERAPAVSSDGRFIAFSTSRALVADDTNNALDIYLYDRGRRELTLVSRNTAGQIGNSGSVRPQLSSNGRYLVFESGASNLVDGDSNGLSDVFRRDRITGETVRVSVASDGTQGNGSSFDAVVSTDGNLVAFVSNAFNLVANDANGASDIFLRDVAAGTTDRISVGTSGGDADLASGETAISADGRFVAFSSMATNLVAGDNNGKIDIFVRDRSAGTTTRASVTTNGVEANNSSRTASLSRDGRFVAFVSNATNLIPGSGPALYVRDLQSAITTRPAGPSSPVGAEIAGDGRFAVMWDFSGGLSVSDRFGNVSTRPSGTSGWLWPVLSDTARYIVALDTSGGGRVVVCSNPFSF